MYRTTFYVTTVIVFALIILLSFLWLPFLFLFIIAVPLALLGFYDIFQRTKNILRNYPIIGHFRYMLLAIRPQIQQYFIETETGGKPFSKEERQMVYSRAQGKLDTLPFGTLRDVFEDGFESIHHSLAPCKPDESVTRITVGGPQCTQPYNASRLNISAMSFGALSKNAIRALNRGAKIGNFAHNTGEGGLSPYHLQEGGDVIWQVGTACFGCRTKDGKFDPEEFKKKSRHPAVKMIEIKLSQGAKPAHGGILPAVKVTEEIAKIRGLEPYKDAVSPPAFEHFSTPNGLIDFVQELRDLCGGKPVGFKLCIGNKSEFLGICKSMVEKKIYPDFITIDGAEGGTGAAPVEFTDFIGTPLDEGLVFAYNALVGCDLKKHIKLICSGKIISGFDMVSKMALGADMCNSARGMLFSLGCVQSRRCNTNTCPTGVATQDPKLYFALDIDKKAPHVANFHKETIESFKDVLGAAGINNLEHLYPSHIHRRIDHATVLNYDEIYEFLQPGQLLLDDIPDNYAKHWFKANAEKF